MTCSRCPHPADVWAAVNADPMRLCYGCHLAATAAATATGGWIATDWTADLTGLAPRFPRRPVSEPEPPPPPPRAKRADRPVGPLVRRAVLIPELCNVAGCDRRPVSRGMCDRCARIARRAGNMDTIANPPKPAQWHGRKNKEKAA